MSEFGAEISMARDGVVRTWRRMVKTRLGIYISGKNDLNSRAIGGSGRQISC